MKLEKKGNQKRRIQNQPLMPKPIKAAGGVVFRIKSGVTELLLIYRNGVWDLPKGKLEKGESIPMCASREVAEETGSELPIIISDLGTTYHEYIQKSKEYQKTTFWFSMILPKDQALNPQTEEGIEQIDWIPIDEASEIIGYDNLRIIIDRFREFIA